MKKIFLILAVASLSLSSCTRHTGNSQDRHEPADTIDAEGNDQGDGSNNAYRADSAQDQRPDSIKQQQR